MQTNSLPALVSSRRRFVQHFALLVAASVAGTARWSAKVLARIQDTSAPGGGVLRLRISDFPPLQRNFGSVRIGTSAIGPDHRPLGLFYPVVINRAAADRYYALDASCSHEGCTVPTLNAESQLIQCLCHGSQYGIDGTLVRGPAGFGLRQFTVGFDGKDALQIDLPDVSFFAGEPIEVLPNHGRVHLRFLGFEQITYEVWYRSKVNEEWRGAVLFALTESGPLDQTVVVGQANFVDVYVEPPASQAFYAIVMKTSEV